MKTVEFTTDNQLNDLPQKRLTNLQPVSNHLVPVTVMLTPSEKENLEQLASECETELGKYIAVRSQMSVSDVSKLEKTIAEQKTELERLKINLSFYSRGNMMPEQTADGFIIPMNRKQLEYMKAKFLESYENESAGDFTMSDGRDADHFREYLEEKDTLKPGSIDSQIAIDLMWAFFYDIDKRLTTYNDPNYFDNGDYDSTYGEFENLEDKK